MVSERKKLNKTQAKTLDSDQSPPPDIFRSILSQIEASQGLKSPILKRLYNLLSYLSSFQQGCVAKEADINGFVMKIGNSEVWVAYKEIGTLSDVLYKEFHQRFEQLFYVRHDLSENMALGRPGSQQADMWDASEELNLLFRCCMIVLNLPMSQENLLENGKALLLILRKLSLLKLGGKEKNDKCFEMLLSSECANSEKDCAASSSWKSAASSTFVEPLNSCIPFLSAILEVFVDELLLHGQLRKKLLLFDSICPTSGRQFMHLSNHDDIGIVMELISAYFSLSVFDEPTIKDFLNRLAWVQGKKFKASTLSLVTARTLLLDPIMRSAPKLLRAHLISLVSDTIGIGMGSESLKPDPKLVHCYLSAFESSVILYSQDISWLQNELHPIGARASLLQSSTRDKNFQLSYDTYLEKSKKTELDHVITKLNVLWHSQLTSTFSRTKSDLVTLCTSYIQDSQYILDMSCRDEILSITGCMLVQAADNVQDISVSPNGSTSLEDICLLASLLKLMSSSLLQALWCLRYSGDPHCLKALKDFSFVSIISCFEEFNIHLQIQTSLCIIMETHPTKHKEPKLMLLHFLGLLSLSFRTGLDFLVKGCIFIIMALMNLFVFEEGNLGALRSLTDRWSEFSLSVKPPVNSQMAMVDPDSSQAAASEFQKIQNLNLRTSNSAEGEDLKSENPSNTSVSDSMEHVPTMEEQVCNGEIFLRSMLGESGGCPDFDDLSDFIVCKKGKNYARWLKHREHYRKKKFAKGAKSRWNKRKKTYRSVMGK